MTMHLGEATIGTGSSGEAVKKIQTILTGQGYNTGPIDGIYGPLTQQAIMAFQKTKGLFPDGIVGPLTWRALQGEPPAPAPMPQTVIEAPDPGMGMLGKAALIGIAGLLLLSFVGKR